MDRSAKMLTLLRQRLGALPPEASSRARLKRGDMTELRGLGRYPLILATFNVVGHLATFEEMAAFLGCVRHHLARGGEFVFDVPVPSAEELGADPDEWFRAPRFKHPKTGEWLSQAERFEYNPVSQVLRVESEFRRQGSRDAVIVPLVLRQWFPKELESLLYYAGFREVRLTADYTGQGLYGDVDMLVVHAS